MFKGWRFCLFVVAVIVLLPNFFALILGLPNLWEVIRPKRSSIIISPETTFIESPTLFGGYIDYTAALRERTSAGVTPENNALVVAWQVMGSRFIPEEQRREYFRELGIPVPDEDGLPIYLWPSHAHGDPAKEKVIAEAYERLATAEGATGAKTKLKFKDAYWRLQFWAKDAIWSKDDLPFGEEWLQEQQPYIQLLIDGSRRPRFYTPCLKIDGNQPLSEFDITDYYLFHNIDDLLRSYALGKCGSGDTAAATSAMLAAVRWNRLLTRAGSKRQWLRGVNWGSYDLQALALIACSGQMDATELRQLRNDIRRLPPPADLAELFNYEQRLLDLDYITTAERLGLDGLFPDRYEHLKPGWSHQVKLTLDWNELLRQHNRLRDFQVRILRTTDYDEQEKLIEELLRFHDRIDQDNEQLIAQERGINGRLLWELFFETTRQQSWATNVMVHPRFHNANLRMMETVLALCLYKAEHGVYPPQLSDLIPAYWPDAPAEPFIDPYNRPSDFAYHPDDKREEFVLYSFGLNKTNDGGRNYDDDYDADDIVMRSKSRSISYLK